MRRSALALPAILCAALLGAACASDSTGPSHRIGSDSDFDVELLYVGATRPTSSQRAIIAAAAARWESVMTAGLPDNRLEAEVGACGPAAPALDQVIDDVLILLRTAFIDGSTGVIAQSGPCFVRADGLTIAGEIVIDEADLSRLEEEDYLFNVAMHEMGHVLGFGSLWRLDGLLVNAAEEGGTDPHFVGSWARAAFDELGGIDYEGPKVPVHGSGGPGIEDSHWRASVIRDELMRPFIRAGRMPLSRLTLASMRDLGYAVDLSAADVYAVQIFGVRGVSEAAELEVERDVMRRPVIRVDASGRPLGTEP